MTNMHVYVVLLVVFLMFVYHKSKHSQSNFKNYIEWQLKSLIRPGHSIDCNITDFLYMIQMVLKFNY